MQDLRFGKIALSGPRLAFGGGAISGEGGGYGFGAMAEEQAISLLTYALERGIKVYDTAPIYGFEVSEKRLGKAFQKKREQIFLVSKSGITWHDNQRVDLNNSADMTLKMLEQSLINLRTDYIDLYMVHWPDPRTDIRETMEVLRTAKEQGKIKYIGLSNTNKDEITKALEVVNLDALQFEYNLFSHSNLELFQLAQESDWGVMTWGTLEKGIITGSVTEKRRFDQYDCRKNAPWWKQMDKKSRFRAMERIFPLLEGEGFSGLELALGFVVKLGERVLPLVGMKTPKHVDSALRAIEKGIPDELVQRCIEIVDEELK